MNNRAASKQNNIIYDVGMHRGEDTSLYLRKGFSVVAFEADPELAQSCRERFPREVSEGRLTVIEGAIVPDPSVGSIRFYKNPVATLWGTIDPEWKDRNKRMGWDSNVVEVPAIDFAACIEQHGMPYYLKIDIEGADFVCLQTLSEFESRPDYVSIESSKTSLDSIKRELSLLEQLGYDRFKAVQQGTVMQQHIPDPPLEGTTMEGGLEVDSSGLFGKESPGAWHSHTGVLLRYRFIMLGYKLFGNDTFVRRNRVTRKIWRGMQKLTKRPIPGWFDTHARHSSAN